jgi:hypothetical protein
LDSFARTLILEDYPEQNMKFLDEQGIQFLQFGIAGNKVKFWQDIFVKRYTGKTDDTFFWPLSHEGAFCPK